MIQSHSKYLVVDLTIPIVMEPFPIIVPWPKKENRLLAPIRPFQPLVKNHLIERKLHEYLARLQFILIIIQS